MEWQSKKPRALGETTCEKKRRYLTKDSADRVIRRMWETYHKEGEEGGYNLNDLRRFRIYQCRDCSKFHIGKKDSYVYGVNGPK